MAAKGVTAEALAGTGVSSELDPCTLAGLAEAASKPQLTSLVKPKDLATSSLLNLLELEAELVGRVGTALGCEDSLSKFCSIGMLSGDLLGVRQLDHFFKASDMGYSIMTYTATGAVAIRETKLGKRQLFQIRNPKKSIAQLKAILEKAKKKLLQGEPAEQVKLWAKEQAGQ